MRQAFLDVIEFEEAAGHEVSIAPPAIPSERVLRHRMWLIEEEVNRELMPALESGDLAEIADGIADAIFVLVGTAVRFGIDLPAVWAKVAAANLAKFGEGAHRDPATGKVLKPPGWMHPDVAAVLRDQAPLAETYRDVVKLEGPGKAASRPVARLSFEGSSLDQPFSIASP